MPRGHVHKQTPTPQPVRHPDKSAQVGARPDDQLCTNLFDLAIDISIPSPMPKVTMAVPP